MSRLTRAEEEEGARLAAKFEKMTRADFGPARPGPAAFRGRPSLTAPGVHSPSLRVYIAAPLLRKVRADAAQKGETLSQTVRRVLGQHYR